MKNKIFTLIISCFLISSCEIEDPATPKTNANNNNSQNGIVGIWSVYKPNIWNTYMEWSEIVFYANGTSSEWVPKKGLHNYDPTTEPDKNSGVYTWNGTTGQNKTGPQSQYVDELSLKSEKELRVGSHIYHRCAAIDGKKIQGSYTSYADPSDPSIQTLEYGKKPVITFNSDGTFNDEGLFNTVFYNDPQPAPGGGTYELKNFSIIMNYTDGRVRQCSFHGAFSNAIDATGIIFIEGMDINKM